MQEAFGRAWTRESTLAGGSRQSLKDLNCRFLELAASGGGWSCSEVARIAAHVGPLTTAQRAAAADCPYALFDLRFGDALHWQTRLPRAHGWIVADDHGIDAPLVNFVSVALFYAWHIAAMAGQTVPLLLGMSLDTAAMFRATTLDNLTSLAVTEAVNLTARWGDCAAYWSALAVAASGDNGRALRRVQLHGLQLTAASRLAAGP